MKQKAISFKAWDLKTHLLLLTVKVGQEFIRVTKIKTMADIRPANKGCELPLSL